MWRGPCAQIRTAGKLWWPWRGLDDLTCTTCFVPCLRRWRTLEYRAHDLLYTKAKLCKPKATTLYKRYFSPNGQRCFILILCCQSMSPSTCLSGSLHRRPPLAPCELLYQLSTQHAHRRVFKVLTPASQQLAEDALSCVPAKVEP